MPPKILLGQSDFRLLREDGGYYIDKSSFVRSVLDLGALVQLYPRPRRFGKTLNLSTLRYFLEKGPDRSHLFSDLEVWQDAGARRHFQRYPVINLSFRDVKQDSWEGAKSGIVSVIREAIAAHAPILESPAVDSYYREQLRAVLGGGGEPDQVLKLLCAALFQQHGERVVVLIDEYDSPILSGWEYGYYAEVASFFRSFLGGGLKDNPHLFRGVLTGILRVAKESMFSGLNNLAVYSLLQNDIPEPFGFTEAEVDAALSLFDRNEQKEEIRRWYNGYHFGEQTVYNPWSLMNVLSRPRSALQAWWLNTSDNAPIRSLLLRSTELAEDFATLLSGGSVEKEIEENVVLREMRPDNLWSFFLFSGYLTTELVRVERGRTYAALRIPNLEVGLIWEGSFTGWLRNCAGDPSPLQKAILSGDAEGTQRLLGELLLKHVSSHDVAATQDEAFYHAFVLGMLVSLERTHRVRSNRESGLGRADLLILPRQAGQPGVVME
ncbi:MAG TPA: AAA family ATPase, partial [Myxococcota bacterium]|nr:AAA family ATPase [Myxococcota bacterium]